MTKAQINSNFSKSKGRVILEYILLALCLCVIALRTTFTEGPTAQSAALPGNFGESVYSLSISAVLILSFVVWCVWSLCSRRFLYRFTGIEAGLCILIIAVIVAGFAAANKRAAITGFVTQLAPILMAVLLVQILDSHSKIKLLLVFIAALGVVQAYQCAEQLLVGNQAMIEQYEQDPQTLLEPLGIQPNTLQHFQFEHRLYTRGVRGFFTTSNSAGSFALLASFAAVALFLEKLKNRKFSESVPSQFIIPGLAVAVVVFTLAVTRSKGAIAASLIAAAIFVIYFFFADRLKAHKKAILIVCLLLTIAGAYATVSYGVAHGRLPGGNSMLVRWQYWHASARMYADHPLTGIGPGNFAAFYPHYKLAEALESVADPHNFLLAVLTQYGPLGLVGFLAMIFLPLWKIIFADTAGSAPKNHQSDSAFRRLAVVMVIVVSAALLLVRPIIIPATLGDTLGVMAYVTFILYLAPVIAFAVGFWLFTTGPNDIRNTNIIAAALFCAVLGCLIHNLIDFAIFEPGVFTTLWAIIACLIALNFHQNSQTPFVLKHPRLIKMIVAPAALLIIWAYFNYCLIPPAKANAKIQQAHLAASYGQFEQAHSLLAAAAEDDYLSPLALSLNARLYLQSFHTTGRRQADLLQAEKSLLAAIERSTADFKNFERLTEVYTLLAETSIRKENDWRNKAFDSALQAVELYPGCGRLRFKLAQIAERLGKTTYACRQYKKAIDIEDSFRTQFQIMYPARQIFSRLGEEKYSSAKQRVKLLCP